MNAYATLAAAILTSTVTAGLAHASTIIDFSGAIVDFTAAETGLYDIVAYGAQGGSGASPGGLGAEVGGDILLTKGEVLTILVGGEGDAGVAGGGGGATFINQGSTPLLVAGGGGGGSVAAGGPGLGTGHGVGPGAHGGPLQGGGGGADEKLNGGQILKSGGGGKGFANGGAGGAGKLLAGNGGFGGGGGGYGADGGGGGGFHGGNGGRVLQAGDGGSSYIARGFTNKIDLSGENAGAGLAIITTSGVPEPAAWAISLMGFGALGMVMRRRRAAGLGVLG
ncbi:MAG TPA: PEP-CTERM sorting domain-containing protein [Caulobacteraceae bacterium]|jgi:hypothetical protein|nr:PEP-CTERM sorting domain-containing protein [Caulobacteraceae bacterium]